MVDLAKEVEGQLRPLRLIPGCNTADEEKLKNIKINTARELPWLGQKEPHDRPLVIVGGGPSLKDRWQEITSHNGDILALNNAYGYLLERGIKPDYFMLLDARPHNVDFVKAPCDNTLHFIAAQCNPVVFEALEGNRVCLYLTQQPGTEEIIKYDNRPKVLLGAPAGTVGMKALTLAWVLGYRELHLYGYDSSYSDKEHHAFAQPLNDTMKTIEVAIGGRRYITTPAMAQQATEFCGIAGAVARSGISMELHCSGLLPDMVAYCNMLGETPLEEREQAKYTEMWKYDAYRKEAPGEHFVKAAIDALGMLPGESVNDYGCGTGRAAQKFKDAGYKITAFDFAENCLDNGVDVEFHQACLWNLPDIKSDYGYCTDVMEHIPPEKVLDVIQGIAERSLKGAFFNIATSPDNLGGLIGRKLHVSVMQPEAWQELLERYFSKVRILMCADGEVAFVCHT